VRPLCTNAARVLDRLEAMELQIRGLLGARGGARARAGATGHPSPKVAIQGKYTSSLSSLLRAGHAEVKKIRAGQGIEAAVSWPQRRI
jgi:hypothetical protein